ncbi:MAG: prepilin-type N-terminal cleavage/methylation domain-containing protein [Bacteriovoracia bacterium]
MHMLRDQRGFTIIESLFAVGMLAIVLAGALLSFSTSSRMYAHLRYLEPATQLASSTIEQISLMYPSQAEIQTGTSHTWFFSIDLKPVTVNGFFTVSWQVMNHPSVPNVRRIELTVIWMEDNGPRHIDYTFFRS